jgi:hypothetical protein
MGRIDLDMPRCGLFETIALSIVQLRAVMALRHLPSCQGCGCACSQ